MEIKSGTVEFHVKDHPTMITANGSRTFKEFIAFDEHFRHEPTVHLAIQGMDLINDSNHRVSLGHGEVKHDGFELVFHTWADTHIYQIAFSWVAYAR